ncbi:hypothetical protein MHH33_17370 [Paenisporosarcina sp. FSL H8-0542]|uniref:hypothetical protein n=1 Tax=Paenisporosarcina sp. FSL H8-0542 TaxID=2921401 RepID=UPI00315B122B
MAIHNGNHDFYLSVLQSATRQLKISFKTPANATSVSLIVQRPGDSGIVKTQTISSSPGQNHTVYVEVPYYGEYYVKVDAVRGAIYDYFIRPVKLLGTHTQKKTFTQADVDQFKTSKLVALFVGTAIGLTATGVIAKYVTLFTAAFTMAEIGAFDTEDEDWPDPRVGWGLRTTMYDNGSAIQIKWEALDQYGNVQRTQNGQINYIKW